MQTLLFEMTPRQGHEAHYFRHAAALRPILAQHEGLLFIERFKSVSREGVILSHSLWRDEAAIARWRTDRQHHQSQAAGRHRHFADYRIRISHALRFRGEDGVEATWAAAGLYAEPGHAADRYITIVRSRTPPTPAQGESFVSVSEASSYLGVRDFPSADAAWQAFDAVSARPGTITALLARVSRDYGMFDRAEAPQYFPPVTPDAVPGFDDGTG